jgi:hypothetical protein
MSNRMMPNRTAALRAQGRSRRPFVPVVIGTFAAVVALSAVPSARPQPGKRARLRRRSRAGLASPAACSHFGTHTGDTFDVGTRPIEARYQTHAPAITLPQVRAGTIKAYAVMAKSRLATAPDIPRDDEAGLPGFYVTNWWAL